MAKIYKQPYFYFIIALLICLLGFWPTFFSKIATNDFAHLIHGFSATAWMAVPILQAWLISQSKYRQHRQVGRGALILVPVVFVSGMHMVRVMISGSPENQELLILKLAFLDISAMILFVVFVALAIWSVRKGDSDAHARYLAASVLFALEPALERVFVAYVPGVSGFDHALYLSLISIEIILIILLLIEWRRGRIRPPFMITLGFFALIHIFATPVATSSTFRELARWFANAPY